MNKKLLSLLFASTLLLSACGEGEAPEEVKDEELKTEKVTKSPKKISSKKRNPKRKSAPVAPKKKENTGTDVDEKVEEFDERLQEDMAVVLTQNLLKESGFNDYDSGTRQYNISSIDTIDGVKRWNVTSMDSTYGRIKVMFDWDGGDHDGQMLTTPQFLLVGGEVIYDHLTE